MANEKLKIELVQKILRCEDTKLLMELQQLLNSLQEIDGNETKIEFIPENETKNPEDFSVDDPNKKL